jgi:hypothetical protein
MFLNKAKMLSYPCQYTLAKWRAAILSGACSAAQWRNENTRGEWFLWHRMEWAAVIPCPVLVCDRVRVASAKLRGDGIKPFNVTIILPNGDKIISWICFVISQQFSEGNGNNSQCQK